MFEFPICLSGAIGEKIVRRRISRSDSEEGALVIEALELEKSKYVSRPDKVEFAGSFVSVVRGGGREVRRMRTCLTLGLSDLLECVGALGDECVIVMVVLLMESEHYV